VLEPAKSKIVIPTGSALKALSLAADVCVPEHIRPQQAGGKIPNAADKFDEDGNLTDAFTREGIKALVEALVN
jgi:hypothetical protein